MSEDRQALRRLMRVFPTGVTIVLARAGDDVHGMTANAVCSISLEPPLMMVSVDNRSRMKDLLAAGAPFSINVLRAGQAGLADQFARRWAWRSGEIEFADRAGAVVLDGSLAALVCDVERLVPAGDHTMVLGRVREAEFGDGYPLIFLGGSWTSFPGPEDVFLLDRSRFREHLQASLPTDLDRAALLVNDMTRGHLDPELATMPVPPPDAEALLGATAAAIEGMRARRRPIVYAVLEFTADDVLRNPFFRAVDEGGVGVIPWRATRLSAHNREGSRQVEIMPEVAPRPGDVVITGKRRYSAFSGTCLGERLEELGVDTLVLAGMHTNTTILHTAFDAFCRDLKVVVLSDCTKSVYGPDLHELALRNVEYSVGWVTDSRALLAAARTPAAPAGT